MTPFWEIPPRLGHRLYYILFVAAITSNGKSKHIVHGTRSAAVQTRSTVQLESRRRYREGGRWR